MFGDYLDPANIGSYFYLGGSLSIGPTCLVEEVLGNCGKSTILELKNWSLV